MREVTSAKRNANKSICDRIIYSMLQICKSMFEEWILFCCIFLEKSREFFFTCLLMRRSYSRVDIILIFDDQPT